MPKLLKYKRIIITLLIIILFIVFNILSYLSDGTHIGGDSYLRYQYARYAFQYPEFFLNHWAKPIFIALAAPFAQLGYFGIKLFNITIGLLLAYFAYFMFTKYYGKPSGTEQVATQEATADQISTDVPSSSQAGAIDRAKSAMKGVVDAQQAQEQQLNSLESGK